MSFNCLITFCVYIVCKNCLKILDKLITVTQLHQIVCFKAPAGPVPSLTTARTIDWHLVLHTHLPSNFSPFHPRAQQTTTTVSFKYLGSIDGAGTDDEDIDNGIACASKLFGFFSLVFVDSERGRGSEKRRRRAEQT